MDFPMHGPHQKTGVEIFRAQLIHRPALTPLAEAFHDLRELLSSFGQMILAASSCRTEAPLDDAGTLQRLQSLCKQALRHARKPLPQLAEEVAAAKKLAKEQRCPTFRKHLSPHGDWAEL